MPYSYQDFSRRLKKLGFEVVPEGKGSHVIFSDGKTSFPLPKHGGKDISKGVEKKILKEIGISSFEFKTIQ
jgi:predicted RNA binding protein YcfA (HicA-like mRNA interferase family)